MLDSAYIQADERMVEPIRRQQKKRQLLQYILFTTLSLQSSRNPQKMILNFIQFVSNVQCVFQSTIAKIFVLRGWKFSYKCIFEKVCVFQSTVAKSFVLRGWDFLSVHIWKPLSLSQVAYSAGLVRIRALKPQKILTE